MASKEKPAGRDTTAGRGRVPTTTSHTGGNSLVKRENWKAPLPANWLAQWRKGPARFLHVDEAGHEVFFNVRPEDRPALRVVTFRGGIEVTATLNLFFPHPERDTGRVRKVPPRGRGWQLIDLACRVKMPVQLVGLPRSVEAILLEDLMHASSFWARPVVEGRP